MEAIMVAFWFIWAFIGSLIAQKKGRNPGVWAVLGFMLGVPALIVLAILPSKVAKKTESPSLSEDYNKDLFMTKQV